MAQKGPKVIIHLVIPVLVAEMGINPPVSPVGNPLRHWVANLDPFALLSDETDPWLGEV